ncbi:MAG TPA: HXXEE domain-containing protein [Bryobacteraceae bacterium]|nr:HXXEE domain-containing protein [Bryobacteraceae bacterium]
MERRGQIVFLFLILAQAAHSIEEYVTKLYDVFAPARFVSSLISNDLALGFLVANVVLVTFGLWCWAVPVRLGWRAAPGLVWFWTILELGNGISHSALALWRGGYFPGVATAPLLLLFAGWMAVLQATGVWSRYARSR